MNTDRLIQLGRMEEKIDNLVEKVDNLNGIKRRGATAGAAGGGVVTLGLIGFYCWVKSRWTWLPIIVTALLLSGCTLVRVNLQTGQGTYVSVLQKKSLMLEPGRLQYNTEADPAVQIAMQAFAAGLSAAKTASAVTGADPGLNAVIGQLGKK